MYHGDYGLSLEPIEVLASTSSFLLIILSLIINLISMLTNALLRCASNNGKALHSYNIIDYLAHSLVSMLTLKVLQTCPTQQKAMLFVLGTIHPFDSYFLTLT